MASETFNLDEYIRLKEFALRGIVMGRDDTALKAWSAYTLHWRSDPDARRQMEAWETTPSIILPPFQLSAD